MPVPCLCSTRARFFGLVVLALASTPAFTLASRTTTTSSAPLVRAAAPTRVSRRLHVQSPHRRLSVHAHRATEIVHARVIGIEACFPEQGLLTAACCLGLLAAPEGSARDEIVVQVAGAERAGPRDELLRAPRSRRASERPAA